MIRISDKAEPAFFIEPLNKQKGGFRFSFGNVYACLLVGTRDCFKCNIQRPAPPGLPFLCRQERRYLWVMTRISFGNALSLEILFPFSSPQGHLCSVVYLRSRTSRTIAFPNGIWEREQREAEGSAKRMGTRRGWGGKAPRILHGCKKGCALSQVSLSCAA